MRSVLDFKHFLCHWLSIYYKQRSFEHIYLYAIENRLSFEDEGGWLKSFLLISNNLIVWITLFFLLFRKKTVILIIAVASVLVVSGVITGLVVGLRKCKNESDLWSFTGVGMHFSFHSNGSFRMSVENWLNFIRLNYIEYLFCLI